jgi:hypothetical protein
LVVVEVDQIKLLAAVAGLAAVLDTMLRVVQEPLVKVIMGVMEAHPPFLAAVVAAVQELLDQQALHHLQVEMVA